MQSDELPCPEPTTVLNWAIPTTVITFAFMSSIFLFIGYSHYKHGWFYLSKRYSGVYTEILSSINSIAVIIGRGIFNTTYSNTIKLDISKIGIGISIYHKFKFGNKPLAIPWADLREGHFVNKWYSKRIKLITPDGIGITLYGKAAVEVHEQLQNIKKLENN